MFKPPAAPVSVLEAPFQITIEFTDYASYQHHQFRQQQYQQQLERQEQNRRDEEHHRQYYAQFHSHIQTQLQGQNQSQSHNQIQIQNQSQNHGQFQYQQQFQQQFPTHQSPAFAAPFQQPLPSDLPSELSSQIPAGQGLMVFQRQQQLAHQLSSVSSGPEARNHADAASHGRSDSLPETAGLININADFACHGPASSAHAPAIHGFLAYRNSNEISDHSHTPLLELDDNTHLMHYQNHQAQQSHQVSHNGHVHLQANGQGQLHPATTANATAPSPIDPIAHTPSTALATGAFPVNSPPVCNNSDAQHFNSASPTFIAAPSPHNNMAAPTSSAVSSSPHATASPTSPSSTTNSLRQLHHPRRQHHHANYNNLDGQQPFQHSHPYNYHQHLHQQIQERRLKKAHTFPVVHPGVYAFPDTPHYSGNINSSVISLPSQLLQKQQQLHQQQEHQQPHQLHQQGHIQEYEQYHDTRFIYPTYPVAAMPVDYEQVTALDQEAIDAEIAAQQTAAQNYRPDTEGPGVDELHITEDLQKLYTNADASFVEKTSKLPRAFPLYRPVRGDGNCGWRAIGFCYFELLVHSKDANLITAERARLLGLNDYIRNIGGYDPYVYEDMVEETDILLGNIIDVYPDYEKAMEAVSTAFNDAGASNAIIYHLRLLAASYLKENAEKYDGFLAHEMGIVGYCQDWIERPNCEIDHLRMELLTNILLKSSDMVLEIAYLDRNESDVLPTYRFPESNVGRLENTIARRMSLLFRPDHYDILYRPSLPSREVAGAVLSRFHTPEDVATCLTLDWVRAATIVAGEPVAEPASVDVAVVQTIPDTQSQHMDPFPIHQPLSIYEDTPDLTPGSSINSPAMFQVKGEPLTPVLAPSGAPVEAVPQAVLSMIGADTTNTSGLVAGTGEATETRSMAIGAAATGVDARTSAAPIPTSTSSGKQPSDTTQPSAAKRIKLDGASGQSVSDGQASTAQEPSGPAAAPSSSDIPSSNDYKVFHVGSITYGDTESSQTSQSGLLAGADLFAQLPFLLGTAPSETNSALFGTGNWSSSSLRSRFSNTFATPPLSAHPPPKAPEQSVQAAPTSTSTPSTTTPAPVPASDLMPPPPAPAAKKAEPRKDAQPATSSALETQREPIMRFTQWHYKGKKASHDAMDRGSTSFRSKMSTAAHFCSSQFQPDVYNPASSEGTGRSSGRNGSARFHEEEEESVSDSQWQ
ncbi:ubiquitin thioesterase [Ophiostoma piceae UAMH 11346]|uniref:ubiquitinyl hydrolase 1 n=1 Tax=Ophiostoma piceae (strain UAMH 11346) TaxID=1262450 RepID=S3D2K4_OPHP1|nr:ubiquitin thioesterase [Ophiostoma piceae UAMH 11346]